MQSDANKTVDALHPVAVALADHILDYWPKLGWNAREWGSRPKGQPMIGARTAPGKFMFRAPNGSHVTFYNVTVQTPIPREAITVGPLEETGERVPKEAEVREMENDSGIPLKRILGKRDTEGAKEGSASSIGTTIGASMAFRARQEIGYGDRAVHGAEGTTELELSISASVERAVNDSAFAEAWREHEKTEGLEAEYQPHMGYRLERTADVCPARQVTTLQGQLDYGLNIEFHGVNFFGWPSRDYMFAAVKGIQIEENPFGWINAYRKFPILNPEEHPLGQPVYATVENVLNFDHVSNVRSRVTDHPIGPGRRLVDALRTISENESRLPPEFAATAAGELARLTDEAQLS